MGTLQDLRGILKRLKHRDAKVKYCPCCGSPKLKLASGFDFWLAPGKYVCLDCGYNGPIVMEKDDDSKEDASF